MKEEKILVTQSSMPDYKEYCEKIKQLWDSKWLTNVGVFHEELRENLKTYLGIDNIELFSNGHSALLVALKALNLKGEIITTPFTFVSTTNAIVDCGCTPVFCDIDKKTFTIDTNKIESLITKKTVAIMPVNVYGSICDVKKIEEIAKKHNLKVIYDSAHCFGVEYKGKSILDFGDISMLSFHATKVYNTIEGGALVINKDKKLLEKVRSLRNFGLQNDGDIEQCGLNAKMNEFQSAMGICNLKHIDDEISKRKKVSDLYDKLLKNVKGIQFLKFSKDVKRNYAYYPIVVDKKEFGCDRDRVFEVLAQNNIYARKYFYPITNQFSVYQKFYKKYPTPIAKDISQNVLCLPMYANLDLKIVEKICDLIKNM